eukprot:3935869-Rhodomonas_salina.3
MKKLAPGSASETSSNAKSQHEPRSLNPYNLRAEPETTNHKPESQKDSRGVPDFIASSRCSLSLVLSTYDSLDPESCHPNADRCQILQAAFWSALFGSRTSIVITPPKDVSGPSKQLGTLSTLNIWVHFRPLNQSTQYTLGLWTHHVHFGDFDALRGGAESLGPRRGAEHDQVCVGAYALVSTRVCVGAYAQVSTRKV